MNLKTVASIPGTSQYRNPRHDLVSYQPLTSEKSAALRRGDTTDMKKVIPFAILALLLVPAFVLGAKSNTTAKPSIVLIHGAWADGSSWSRVVELLQAQGYTVYVPANPLRGLASDSAYIAGFLQSITGPIILVGHSYGGAVITNAAVGNSNVKALVFINAFAPAQGETVFGLNGTPPPPGQSGSCLGTNPFNLVNYPGTAPDVYVKPSVFPSCFANDLPPNQAAVLASTQRPIAFSAGSEPSGVPAWKTIPSWYLVGTIDNVVPPYLQLFMAHRANSQIVEVTAGHLSMISHPDAVAALIQQAAQDVQGDSNMNSELALAPAIA